MTRVKVCGITRPEDALLAADLGAWAVGFIFWEKSPRYIRPGRAGDIVQALQGRVLPVGVFVNATVSQMKRAAEESGIQVFQLHGDEPPELCTELGGRIFRALRPATEEDLLPLSKYKGVEAFLVDAAVHGQYGGTGQLAKWELAARAKKYGPVILSGGLDHGNVAQGISEVGPFAVDVSSGVEKSAGVKDPERLRKFFAAARSVESESEK